MAAMTIARLAAEGGVGVETIRYYQRRGLLTEPARVFAEQLHAVAFKYGLKLLGGCCGTAAEHIAAVARRFAERT